MIPRKTDNNPSEIVEALVALGVFVVSLHTVGRGIPGWLCAYRDHWYVVEIKNGWLGWKFTEAQKKFRRRVAFTNAPIVVLDSVESAITWVNRLNTSPQQKFHKEPPVTSVGVDVPDNITTHLRSPRA